MIKKLWMVLAIIGIIIFCMSSAYCTEQWREDGSEHTILGGEQATDIDQASYENIVVPIDRVLAGHRQGLYLQYLGADTIRVTAGECVVSDAGGTTRLFQRNTTSIDIGWGNIDVPAEATSTTYYVYAYQNVTATFTVDFFISTSVAAPTGGTYFLRLGSFYNNAAGNIERIFNDDYSTRWEIDGTETQLDQADEIDMQSKKIINLTDPTDNQDAATKAYADALAGIGAGAVTQAKLATATGSVSTAAATILTLPGGSYGFYPQIKATGAIVATICGMYNDNENPGGAYTTRIYFYAIPNIAYAQQRYVTASGKDHWIFLLLDKDTKDIISAWEAPDHVSYGNGGDPMKVPHPWTLDYDSSEYRIILIENENRKELQQEAIEKEIDLLELINENYRVDWQTSCDYIPLHSGKFLGEAPVLIYDIPSYIKVKKLIELTDTEKVAKEDKKEADKEAEEQAKIDKENKRNSGKEKLKEILSDEEIDALFE